jgi:dCMP deaminase
LVIGGRVGNDTLVDGVMHKNDMEFCVRTIRTLSGYSRANRARVGCVIWHVPSRRIISMGYNGTPEGMDNTMEMNGTTLPEVVHAEMNALKKLSWYERWVLLKDSALFVTHTPCMNCATEIVSTRIPVVYYLENYGNAAASVKLLRDNHRTVLRLLER